ncbi:MAG: hypothetical protein JW986_02545 [Methanotrichaceae archaeon]|nr:hypothetical protein [Methanotrichaceae archaeon]
MKWISLLMATLCCALISTASSAILSPGQVLSNDDQALLDETEGYFYRYVTETADGGASLAAANISYLASVEDFNFTSMWNGMAVKFTAPYDGWMLKKVEIAGLIYYDHQNQSFPPGWCFGLEILDSDKNLLYKYADSPLAYFSVTTPFMGEVELPSLEIDGDFYVCIYDRGLFGVGINITAPQDTSFVYNYITGDMIPTETTLDGGVPASMNWVIRAVGE